jgi:glycosyltransferase involved in cell wall biosynthesis
LQVEVVGNLIDTEFFHIVKRRPSSAGSREPFRFFFCGILTARKGVQYLLQAVRILLEGGGDNFEVQVGGDGPYRRSLEDMLKSWRLERHVRLLGMLDREEVRSGMQRCDVFVLPSLGETFGIVLGEAMACGKPVLSTRCGGPEEIVTPETGVLVAPSDAQALAGAMMDFLRHRVAYSEERIRQNVVERFGEQAFTSAMTRLYDAILAPDKEKRAA